MYQSLYVRAQARNVELSVMQTRCFVRIGAELSAKTKKVHWPSGFEEDEASEVHGEKSLELRQVQCKLRV